MTLIGGYELIGAVGSGSTGTVWKALDTRLERHVAVKQLDNPTAQMCTRWRAEARVLAQLEDPHIVEVYEYFEDGADAYIVEEWVEGATLAAVLTAHGSLAIDQALGVLRGALLGLAHAH
ncbi:MAG: protein kinase, partial [Mycobacteriales bacterium]